ncbi:hypothetical protein A0H81_00542 [Grifola frondosa]|uniref:SAGA-associated factor 11 n=1 Tax=Grifola frondosa TaxID=5627 RepID=A0A1C7MT58_GRIFR|nr:hypothetical protein A0H81_00542 [Grifola frondosa]
MPKRAERDEALSELSSRIYSVMIEELLMDVVLEAHQEIAQSRTVCDICHTRPRTRPLKSSPAGRELVIKTPITVGDARPPDAHSSTGTGTNTPVKMDGNIYLECLNCKRQVGADNFAGSCMGLGNSRRGAARNATTKTKLASEAGRSASPYFGSDNGHVSDDGKGSAKGKGKSKAKRKPGSPSVSPAKKSKKAKVTASPVARVKADPDAPGSPGNTATGLTANSQSRVPSKLRDSSTVSSINREQRSSSAESPTQLSSPARSIISTPSLKSTNAAAGKAQKTKQKNGKNVFVPPPPRLSPPRPPPPVVRVPDNDYLIDLDGDETGS